MRNSRINMAEKESGIEAAIGDAADTAEAASNSTVLDVVDGPFTDEAGNIANWATPELVGGGIGGAMDMCSGGASVFVLMEHRDSKDRAKLVQQCNYPLTGVACVDVVVTDLCVLRRGPNGFTLEDVAPGFSADEVMALAEMRIIPSGQLVS